MGDIRLSSPRAIAAFLVLFLNLPNCALSEKRGIPRSTAPTDTPFVKVGHRTWLCWHPSMITSQALRKLPWSTRIETYFIDMTRDSDIQGASLTISAEQYCRSTVDMTPQINHTTLRMLPACLESLKNRSRPYSRVYPTLEEGEGGTSMTPHN